MLHKEELCRMSEQERGSARSDHSSMSSARFRHGGDVVGERSRAANEGPIRCSGDTIHR